MLFASCGVHLLEQAIATARSARPELPLVVVSQPEPLGADWCPYHSHESLAHNLRRCRQSLNGAPIELAIFMLQPANPHRRLQAMAFLLRPRCLLAMNENMGAFEVGFNSALPRHLLWRFNEWRQRLPARPPLFTLWARAAGFVIGLAKPRATPSGSVAPVTGAPRPAGISVVIPSRNGREMLDKMLPAVVQQIGVGEIIVVNNGSSDGSAAMLAARFPSVTVVESAQPLLFPIAVNVGLRAARFSHVCLLNNDMMLAPDFLRRLRHAFDRVPNLFCAAAQIFLPPGLPRQETGKAFLTANPAPSDFPVRCELPIEAEDFTYVLYGSSGCSMYDARRLAQLNGVDETYQPAYVEDLDVGVRAWQQGWPSVFVARAHVVHEHRATMNQLYSKQRLDAMVAAHWLLFLARTLRDRELFSLYWRHAISRSAPPLVGVFGQWFPRRPAVALPDAEILALCSGSVAVFPGRDVAPGQPVTVLALPRLPDALGEATVIVALVDQLGPIPAVLLHHYAEVVTVIRTRPAAFHAALRQTVRKWNPAAVRSELPAPLPSR